MVDDLLDSISNNEKKLKLLHSKYGKGGIPVTTKRN